MGCALASGAARADETAKETAAETAQRYKKIVKPDSRRFYAPSAFAYWAGTERVLDGELSPAAPRPFEGVGLTPELDDHQSTTAYVRGATAVRHRDPTWNLLEVASLHDLRGGAVLGTNFRVDAREQTAISGLATLAVPLPRGFWVVPTLGVGGRTATSALFTSGAEVRTDRTKPVGYTLGVEATRWTFDRTRVLAKVGAVYRLAPAATIEQRVALGGWDGAEQGGDVAVQWTSAALQTFGERFALYERVTLAQGAALPVDGKLPDGRATSLDVALAFRHALWTSYGFVLQGDMGAQQGRYQRTGLELTLYGALF